MEQHDRRGGWQHRKSQRRHPQAELLAGPQAVVLLGLLDHVLGDAVLHRYEGVLALEFADDTEIQVGRKAAHVDHRRLADAGHH